MARITTLVRTGEVPASVAEIRDLVASTDGYTSSRLQASRGRPSSHVETRCAPGDLRLPADMRDLVSPRSR